MDGPELTKLIVSATTPILVVILGVLLLRRVEGVKASVAMQSSFRNRWADDFFVSCRDFLMTLEKDLAMLTVVGTLEDPNGEYGSQLQKEITALHPRLSELELRIRRSVVFAPKWGPKVKDAATTCLRLTAELIAAQTGNVDEIVDRMDEFNRMTRMAHAEMSGLTTRSRPS